MAEDKKPGVDRPFFRRGAAATAGAAASTMVAAAEGVADGVTSEAGAKKDEKAEKPHPGDIVIERPGSDFMIDVIKTLDLEYISTNPGSSFRSLHESLVNYGGNRKPELLTCMHEEAAVAMAHGYAKAAGKPLGAMIHGSVAVQPPAMAKFNS